MRYRNSSRLSSTAAVAAVLGGLWVWPAISSAQLLPPLPVPTPIPAPVGTLLGATAVLGGTGTIVAGTSDVLQASDTTGGIASLLTGEALHAVTIGYPDQIDSEASLAALALNVAGTSIGAAFVMSRATATASNAAGVSNIDGLSVNGAPIAVTGAPNQTIGIPGGLLVLNEQQSLSDGTLVVNALHAIVSGVADVAVASAMAGLSGGSAKAVKASY
ncbi:MAG TPA: choice-of-anchor P family protein [Burkholderiales bacterium]|nr:choice-of-anchor P family protein [Burkholderiales bacterium]